MSFVPHTTWQIASRMTVQALERYPAGWQLVGNDGTRVWLDDDGGSPEWDTEDDVSDADLAQAFANSADNCDETLRRPDHPLSDAVRAAITETRDYWRRRSSDLAG